MVTMFRRTRERVLRKAGVLIIFFVLRLSCVAMDAAKPTSPVTSHTSVRRLRPSILQASASSLASTSQQGVTDHRAAEEHPPMPFTSSLRRPISGDAHSLPPDADVHIRPLKHIIDLYPRFGITNGLHCPYSIQYRLLRIRSPNRRHQTENINEALERFGQVVYPPMIPRGVWSLAPEASFARFVRYAAFQTRHHNEDDPILTWLQEACDQISISIILLVDAATDIVPQSLQLQQRSRTVFQIWWAALGEWRRRWRWRSVARPEEGSGESREWVLLAAHTMMEPPARCALPFSFFFISRQTQKSPGRQRTNTRQ